MLLLPECWLVGIRDFKMDHSLIPCDTALQEIHPVFLIMGQLEEIPIHIFFFPKKIVFNTVKTYLPVPQFTSASYEIQQKIIL